MAFIASHFHWSHSELMQLDHRERRRWCREISAINRTLESASSHMSSHTPSHTSEVSLFEIGRKQR
ncbi:MAG: hypothetical protein HOP19_25600 [Acidobacteria bacterium]|nr:hypothetical protein [Acidobacteriota bacterium]